MTEADKNVAVLDVSVPDFALIMHEDDDRWQRRAVARQVAGWLGYDHENRPNVVTEIMHKLDPKTSRYAIALYETVREIINTHIDVEDRKGEVRKALYIKVKRPSKKNLDSSTQGEE